MNPSEEDLVGRPLEEVPQREPTAEDCMGRRSSGGRFEGYCRATPGRGTDHVGEGRCKHHGGAPDNRGENNGNYEHGAYSEFEDFVYDSLTERERAAVEAVDFDEDGDAFAKTVVREAYAKYLRTGDDRFLREARQWAAEFGVIDRPADQLEVDAQVDSARELSLDDDTEDLVREVLRQRRDDA